MTIFTRYVFWQATGALLLILLSLTGIVWISLALRELNVVTTSGQSAFTLVKITTLGVPNFIAIIAPFALLIAFIYTLNRLNSDSEIIVLTASGATAWTIVRPILAISMLVALFIAYVNNIGMPWSLRLLHQTIIAIRTDVLTQVIQPGRFTSPEQGLTFHIRERAVNGELEGLLVHDARVATQIQSYLANRAVIVQQNGSAYIVMTEGHILRSTKPEEPAQIIAFDKYAIDLDQFEQKLDKADEYRPRERYFDELVNPDKNSSMYKSQPARFVAEVHERFSSPLYPIAFGFLAVAIVGQAQSTRQNRSGRMAACFAIGAGLRLLGLATNNLVTVKSQYAPLLYAVPAAAIVVALIMIARGAQARSSVSIIDPVSDFVTAVVSRLRRASAEASPALGER
ncbi:MAG: LPS export ABC transporter permease LptF [Hyphomicrobium sp.]|jgi:lipopolysaccharide export system permease protein